MQAATVGPPHTSLTAQAILGTLPAMKLLLPLLALPTLASAAVQLPPVFGDHMILQRDLPVPVWGTTAPGEKVELAFAGQTVSATADAQGKWMAKLAPLKASAEPRELKVGSVALKDVLVGEVWLASGQSNMEWEMQMKPDSKADIPNTTDDQLRIVEVAKTASDTPQTSFSGAWARSAPSSAASFSAVGWYFGKRLREELKVPVGIIQSAWGGTPIQPWTSIEALDASPTLKGLADSARKRFAMPPGPTRKIDAGIPSALYNGMIHPLVPFALRGAIWYQGEANHGAGLDYVTTKRALLSSWRTAFQQPELPFYFVQIAPFQYGEEDSSILPEFWVAQQECSKLPHTGMAVITDIGEVPDIHPAKKKEVARRLSLQALAKTYGRSEIDPEGPLYASHSIQGNAVTVKFSHAESGIASRDGKPLSHFELAARDGVFHPATATIEGSSITLTSAAVAEPRQVRFSWNKVAIPNLMDKDGLAACAFHSHWPVDTDLGVNFALGSTVTSSHPNKFGWDSGLTDGSWGNNPPHCYATGAETDLPKTATAQLKQKQSINQVRMGAPPFGSTKTIVVSISSDGKDFREVGKQEFLLGKGGKAQINFPAAEVSHIRLTYPDKHEGTAGSYPNTFAFTTDLQAYLIK
jgi:sialate O-acetylesterase